MTLKPKYWLLTTEYPPFHGGGISTYSYFTVRMLEQAGYSVTVFVQDDSITDYEISKPETEGVELIRFNSNRNNLNASLGYTARLSYAFADMVRTIVGLHGKPTYIESQDYLGIAYYLTQFKHLGYEFLSGVPIVLTLHSPAFIYLEYNRVPTYRFPDFWTCEMEKQAIKAADLLISPTAFLIEEIRPYVDITGQPVRIVVNPYQSDIKGLPGSIQRNKIVYYGKLSPQKGSFELLEYFKKLWDGGFTHALHIIGGTDIVFHPEMQTMGQLVENQFKKYIHQGLLKLYGKIKPGQIQESLSEAHLIIVPSIVDNLPYVVMEAMSLGKIVLASKQGGQREMIEDGIDGFLFDHSVEGSFSRQLHVILGLTDEQIKQTGLNAQQSVLRKYNPKNVLAEKQAALMQLLQKEETNHNFPFIHQEKMGENIPSTTGNLLTVAVPFYNMGDYIEECVQSVFESTYQPIRILIIDDGSTDKASLDKLEILSRDERIDIFRQENAGLAAARNNGALKAKGDFLAFLDADDKVCPDYYEKAIGVMKHLDNVFFVGSWVRYFGNSTRLWPTFTPQPPYALVHNPVNSSGLVYKRAAFLLGGLNDKRTDYGLEDYESLVNMLHHGYNGVVLPEPLFHYRVRTGSMFRKITREKLMYSNKYIAEKHKVYYAKFAVQIINLLNANGPGFQFDNPSFGVQVRTAAGKDSRFAGKLKSVIKKNDRLKRIVVRIKNKFNL